MSERVCAPYREISAKYIILFAHENAQIQALNARIDRAKDDHYVTIIEIKSQIRVEEMLCGISTMPSSARTGIVF